MQNNNIRFAMKSALRFYMTLSLTAFIGLGSKAQSAFHIAREAGEQWWGGATALGSYSPLHNETAFNLRHDNLNNQVCPLLLSSHGRYVWSDGPFSFRVTPDSVLVDGAAAPVSVKQAGTTLRSAYQAASKLHFTPSGTLPDSLFFVRPQFNTWIELMYNQNERDILRYARSIIANGFPAGVLMIDDNWQQHYGNFQFRPDRFPSPRAMVDTLHSLGFRVMLWISPFVSPDSPEYRELAAKGFLLKSRSTGSPAVVKWWNGQSAVYDLTNPDCQRYVAGVLHEMQQRYGIDGFKFDGGDNVYYDRSDLVSHQPDAVSTDHTRAWAELGLQFPFNEYRACWQMGGQPLVQRLGDKDYSWAAVRQLIPDMLQAGLLGYAYACPDMIGGGNFATFLNVDEKQFDQDLIVRSAQVHALMPMMQFSVAPWRILDAAHLSAIKAAVGVHEHFAPLIMRLAREASQTGEPIVRSMEYVFPHQGYDALNDQFMLGDSLLVAPMVKGGSERSVVLPRGKWRDDTGKTWRGGRTIRISVPLSRLPYFQRY